MTSLGVGSNSSFKIRRAKSDGLECLQVFEKIEYLEVEKISLSQNLFFTPPAIIIDPLGGACT